MGLVRPSTGTLLGVLVAAVVATTHAGAQERSGISAGHVLGDPDAPVTVVEFADFACSACGQFWRETWPRVRAELVETGRVSWRHVPFLLGFRHGDKATKAAECAADQGAFWPMLDLIFSSQAQWMKERKPDALLKGLGERLELDQGVFEVCYDKDGGKDRTRASNRAARAAGVRGTPTFFVNGHPAVGALDFAHFLEVVERAEREARGGSRR